MKKLAQCIICYDNCREKIIPPKDELVENQLQTIFIVKTLLQVPNTVCENLLRTKGNPSTWGIAPCSSCTEIVYEAKFIVKQISSLKKRLKNLQDKCKTKVVESVRKSKSKLRLPYNSVDSIRAEISANLQDGDFKDSEFQYGVSRDHLGDDDGENSEFECIVKKEIGSFDEDVGDELAFKNDDNDDNDDNEYHPDPEDSVIVDAIADEPEVPVNLNLRTTRQSAKRLKPNHIRDSDDEEDTNDFDKKTKSLSSFSGEDEEVEDDGSPENQQLLVNHVNCIKRDSENEPVHCHLCNKTFKTSKGYNTHMDLYHSGDTDCPQCGKNFQNRYRMINHAKIHNCERPFKCDKCSKPFRYENELAIHKAHVHGQNDTRFKGANLSEKDRIVHCIECDRTFKSRAGYKTHMSMAHSGPVDCDKCDLTLANRAFKINHMKTHESGSPTVNFMCEFCPMSFKESRQLEVHQARVHEKPLPVDLAAKITCDICNKVLAYPGSLALHKSTVHRNEEEDKPFKCSMCLNFATMTRTTLARHIKYVHQKVRRLPDKVRLRPCPECDAVYRSKRGVQRHLLKKHGREPTVKLGKKNFKTCPVCEKVLTVSKNGLLIHLNSVHGQKNEFKNYRIRKPGIIDKPSRPKSPRKPRKRRTKKVEDKEDKNHESPERGKLKVDVDDDIIQENSIPFVDETEIS